MNIAIIPARGGSKRIPRKNIKLFKGKPIIAYSIEVAKNSGCFERIIVSTDDPEIAKIAREYGAETPYIRSKKSSDDHASLHEVVIEIIEKSIGEMKIDGIALILPTAPLLSINTVKEVFSSLKKPEYNSALTVVEYGVSPNKALSISKCGHILKQNPELLNNRSQDHKKFYHDAGQVYAFSAEDVVKRNTLTCSKCKAVILARMECQDIDTAEDWFLAEAKYERVKEM